MLKNIALTFVSLLCFALPAISDTAYPSDGSGGGGGGGTVDSIEGDTGGSTTGSAVRVLGGTNVDTVRSGNDITVNATGAGTGDVVGPASSTDNTIVRYDSTTGKLVQSSGVTISDSDVLTADGFNARDQNPASANAADVRGNDGMAADQVCSSAGVAGRLTFLDKDADGPALDFVACEGTVEAFDFSSVGNVVGPVVSVDNEVALMDGITGALLKGSSGGLSYVGGNLVLSTPGSEVITTAHATDPGGISISAPTASANPGGSLQINGTNAGFSTDYLCTVDENGDLETGNCPFEAAGAVPTPTAPDLWIGKFTGGYTVADRDDSGTTAAIQLTEMAQSGTNFTVGTNALCDGAEECRVTIAAAGTYEVTLAVGGSWNRGFVPECDSGNTNTGTEAAPCEPINPVVDKCFVIVPFYEQTAAAYDLNGIWVWRNDDRPPETLGPNVASSPGVVSTIQTLEAGTALSFWFNENPAICDDGWPSDSGVTSAEDGTIFFGLAGTPPYSTIRVERLF